MKKCNNLLTSGRWSKKYPKDYHILDIVGVYQKLADISNKSSYKSNRDLINGEQAYITNLPPWILEYLKGGAIKINSTGK